MIDSPSEQLNFCVARRDAVMNEITSLKEARQLLAGTPAFQIERDEFFLRIGELQKEVKDWEYQICQLEDELPNGAELRMARRNLEFTQRNPNITLTREPTNPEDFELLVAETLQSWGYESVRLTQRSGDGGIDVFTNLHAAQVKKYTQKKVSRPELQQLFGSALSFGLIPLFFTTSGYTKEAIDFSDNNSIACFIFQHGQFKAVNIHGRLMIKGV